MRVLARATSLIVAVLCLLAVAPSPAAASCIKAAAAAATPSAGELRTTRSAVLCLINQRRSSRGLVKLRPNAKLRLAAERHSRNMTRHDFFAHVSPRGTTPLERVQAAGYLSGARSWAVGENIAWGQQQLATPRQIMRSWMRSPAHRANILNRRFRHIGIGISLGTPGYGGPGATYTTAFGKR